MRYFPQKITKYVQLLSPDAPCIEDLRTFTQTRRCFSANVAKYSVVTWIL